MPSEFSLPIDVALPELRAALAARANVVLQAPPGAGKSTCVPLALIDEPWLAGRKIVMLEPRRLAARAIATRMAEQCREAVGRLVGYRTRLETRVSAASRIEVVTEGILTRWLQHDATLEGVGLLIFDEFHERSLNADLGLALSLDAQATVREDLRILVMSATLDGAGVAKLLGDAPLVTAHGRTFDVATHYRERPPGRDARAPEDIARVVTVTALRALEDAPGDALVFLPGQAEIRRVERLLGESQLPRQVRVMPLFGDLAPAEQDAAIRPSASGERKVVLATNIAETSLTIEGVRIVIDSGLARQSRFDPASGMSRLETVRISRASADQRRGRAGRLASGTCYRLWSETEHASFLAQTPPEIAGADLAPLALELASWGIADPLALRWLDPPAPAPFAQARDLLASLEAIDARGRITPHGQALARLATHPRLAHMIVRAAEEGLAGTAIDIAALLEERDLVRLAGPVRDVDFRRRIDALHGRRDGSDRGGIDAGARQRVRRGAEQLARQLGAIAVADVAFDDAHVGPLLALAYPDRIAMSRGEGARYLLSSGKGARLPEGQALATARFLVVADLEGGEREAIIRLAAPIERTDLESAFAKAIEVRERIDWDTRERAVVAARERWLGALQLEERRLDTPDPTRVAAAMLAGVRELGVSALPWTREARALQSRLAFAHRVEPEATPPWPRADDATLLATLDVWLTPWLAGITRRDHLARLDLVAILLGSLEWRQQQRLNEIVPTHFVAPTGSRIAIDYSGDTPTASVRLQELFGLTATPRVGGGRVPLTMELLSPARRPVQVTSDLTSFWARGYTEVRKELKGRYPKHYWPDDPLTAAPTARAKPRT